MTDGRKLPQFEPYGERGTVRRAFEEGLLVGAGFRNSTSRESIGDSDAHQGAFEMGLEKGQELTEQFEETCELAYEVGYLSGQYDQEREFLT